MALDTTKKTLQTDVLVTISLTGLTLRFSRYGLASTEPYYYEPRIENITPISASLRSPLNPGWNISDVTITLDDRDGTLAGYIGTYEFGNRQVTVKVGEGDDPSAYSTVFVGYIQFPNGVQSQNEKFIITVIERSKLDELLLPGTIFSTADYPNLEDKSIGRPIPIVYGDLSGSEDYVPCYCINTSGPTPQFKIACHKIKEITSIYINGSSRNTVYEDLDNAIFNYGPYDPEVDEVVATVKGRVDASNDLIENPVDVIEDILKTWLSVDAGNIDSTTFTQAATDTSHLKVAKVISGYEASAFSIISQICAECQLDLFVKAGKYYIVYYGADPTEMIINGDFEDTDISTWHSNDATLSFARNTSGPIDGNADGRGIHSGGTTASVYHDPCSVTAGWKYRVSFTAYVDYGTVKCECRKGTTPGAAMLNGFSSMSLTTGGGVPIKYSQTFVAGETAANAYLHFVVVGGNAQFEIDRVRFHGGHVPTFDEDDISPGSYHLREDPERLYANKIVARYKYCPIYYGPERRPAFSWETGLGHRVAPIDDFIGHETREDSDAISEAGQTIGRKEEYYWIRDWPSMDETLDRKLRQWTSRARSVVITAQHKGLLVWVGDIIGINYDIWDGTENFQVRSINLDLITLQNKITAVATYNEPGVATGETENKRARDFGTIGAGKVAIGAAKRLFDLSQGINVADTYLGYYDGSVWKVWIGNDGKFRFKGNDNNDIYWNGTTLVLKGTFTIQSATGYGNISDKPTQLSDINTGEGSKLSGIESGADVTANHSAAEIANLPATPAGAGLFASANYLGYYDGSGWKVYIKNDGTFYLQGDASNYVYWNGSTLTVRGALNADDITAGTLTGRTVQTALSGMRVVMETTGENANKLLFYNSSGGVTAVMEGGETTSAVDADYIGAQNLYASDDLTLGDGAYVDSDLRPKTTDSFYLGSPTKEWSSLYITDDVYIGGSAHAANSNAHHNQAHTLSGGDHSGDLAYTQLDSLVGTGASKIAAGSHASQHQNGGADEISVAGLSGELADDQPVKVHDIIDKHSESGLVAGYIIRAQSSTVFAWDELKHSDLEAATVTKWNHHDHSNTPGSPADGDIWVSGSRLYYSNGVNEFYLEGTQV